MQNLNKINVNLIKNFEYNHIKINNSPKVSVIDFIFKIEPNYKSNFLYDYDVVIIENENQNENQNQEVIQFLYTIIFSVIYDEKINKKINKKFKQFIVECNLQKNETINFNYIIRIFVGKKWDYHIFFSKR